MTFIVLFSATAMVYQVTVTAPTIDANSPYSDARIYQQMAQFEGWFGPTHMTHRVVIPAVVGTLTSALGLNDSQQAIQLTFGILNILFFTGGIYLLWLLSFNQRRLEPSFWEVLPLLLILTVPYFWRSAFLPLLDTAAFFFTALMLYHFNQRNGIALFLTLIFAAWCKEIILLSGLMFPLLDTLRDRRWLLSYAMVVVVGITYLSIGWMLTSASSSFYLLQPVNWLSDWQHSFKNINWSQLRFLPSAFGLLLIYFVYEGVQNGVTRRYILGLFILGFFFGLFWLFTPTNTPRLMFIIMPVCYLIFSTQREQVHGLEA